MNVHKNARPTPRGREVVVSRLERGDAPDAPQISRQTWGNNTPANGSSETNEWYKPAARLPRLMVVATGLIEPHQAEHF